MLHGFDIGFGVGLLGPVIRGFRIKGAVSWRCNWLEGVQPGSGFILTALAYAFFLQKAGLRTGARVC